MTSAPGSVQHSALLGLGGVHTRALSLDDWSAYRAFAEQLAGNDLRLRFAGPVKLDERRCRKLLDVDHDREEVFGAFDAAEVLLGVGRLVRVSAVEAEIALIVRSDLKRRGVGRLLLGRLIRHACAVGIAALHAEVLYENLPMVSLAQRAGFRFAGDAAMMVAMRKELDCAN